MPQKYFDRPVLGGLINNPNPYPILNMRELAQTGLPGHRSQIERVVRQARLRVEAEVKEKKTPTHQIAVAFDIDNTLLDATGLELTFRFPAAIRVEWQIQMAKELHDLHIIPSTENLAKLTWMIQAEAKPIPVVRDFLHELKKLGVKIYLVSGRMDLKMIRDATVANLDKAGIKKQDYDGIYFKDPKLSVKEGKAAIYQNIEDKLGHPLFFVMGDQEYDRSGLENSSTLFYLLPNPLSRNSRQLNILPKVAEGKLSLSVRRPVNIFA